MLAAIIDRSSFFVWQMSKRRTCFGKGGRPAAKRIRKGEPEATAAEILGVLNILRTALIPDLNAIVAQYADLPSTTTQKTCVD